MSQCKFCQMENQNPGTNCSHCGRAIPELKPTTLDKAEDNHAKEQPDGVSEGTQEEEEKGQAQTPETEEVTLESGHVDNVGDDSQTEAPVSER